MTATQQKYLRGRLDTIANAKEKTIREQFKAPAQAQYTDRVLAAAKAGTLKVRSAADILKAATRYCYGELDHNDKVYLHAVFVLPSAESDKETKRREADLHKALAALETQKQEALDEIMLGDESRALEILRSFESGS